MRQSKQILTRDVLSTPSAEGFSVPVPVLFLRSALSLIELELEMCPRFRGHILPTPIRLQMDQ